MGLKSGFLLANLVFFITNYVFAYPCLLLCTLSLSQVSISILAIHTVLSLLKTAFFSSILLCSSGPILEMVFLEIYNWGRFY